MADKNDSPAVNGASGRDAAGRFLAGNSCAKRRRRAAVEVPPIPGFLKRHPGVATVWPLLAGLAVQGNSQALKLLCDLALGVVKPISQCAADDAAELGFEDDEDEADRRDDALAEMLRRLDKMSPKEQAAYLASDDDDDEDGPYG